jgi:CRP-like cAMP-binding protein
MAHTVSNRFLATLSSHARASIMARATTLAAPLRTPFYEAEKKPASVFFITSGMASVVATTEDGDTAEVGIIGSEGFVGAFHLIGPAVVSTTSYMQLEGSALRVPYEEFRKLFRSSEEIHDHVLELVQEQALTVSHIAGCNRLHEAEARLARWLLMARDRTGLNVLGFTQEFLGMMLGARRTTVSLVAANLQRVGAIDYVRGRVTIVDGEKLEELACDCYQITKNLHANLYKTSTHPYEPSQTGTRDLQHV